MRASTWLIGFCLFTSLCACSNQAQGTLALSAGAGGAAPQVPPAPLSPVSPSPELGRAGMPAPASVAGAPAPVKEPALAAGSGGAPAMVSQAGAPALAPAALPCDVSRTVVQHCGGCHGATPRLGAPMSLLSAQDFQQPAPSDRSKKVYERAAARVADASNPMPPASSSQLNSDEQRVLREWLQRGAPGVGTAEAASCNTNMPPAPTPTPPEPVAMDKDVTCYDLTVHGKSGVGDESPFMIPNGETYNCFYFDAPWKAPALSVAFRSKLDNDRALHHWFLYAMPSKHADGSVENNCLPLHVDGPKMLAGWAPGGRDMTMPKDVGAETTAPGNTLMLEWHYFNNTGGALADRSSVSVCTVPVSARPNVAAVSWLGTERLTLPAKAETTATGTCTPARAGVTGNAPIHLLYTTPHMHQYGTHVKLEIQRADGSKVSVLDMPFSDRNQNFVETQADVMAGDKLVTSCTFMNTAASALSYGGPFGLGSGEMCYAFVLHYPAHALDNGTRSLLGASNSCL